MGRTTAAQRPAQPSLVPVSVAEAERLHAVAHQAANSVRSIEDWWENSLTTGLAAVTRSPTSSAYRNEAEGAVSRLLRWWQDEHPRRISRDVAALALAARAAAATCSSASRDSSRTLPRPSTTWRGATPRPSRCSTSRSAPGRSTSSCPTAIRSRGTSYGSGSRAPLRRRRGAATRIRGRARRQAARRQRPRPGSPRLDRLGPESQRLLRRPCG